MCNEKVLMSMSPQDDTVIINIHLIAATLIYKGIHTVKKSCLFQHLQEHPGVLGFAYG